MKQVAVLYLIVLLFAVLSIPVHGATLKAYPHLRCSACLAITDFIGGRMNETAKDKSSVKISHRITKGDDRWVDYEKSELRAVEIIEETCKKVESNYHLKERDSIRVFTSDTSLPSPDFYSKKDRHALENSNKKLADVCHELVDEYDEPLTQLIRKVRKLEELQTQFCRSVSKCCGTKAVEKAEKEERGKKERREAKRKRKTEAKKADEEKEARNTETEKEAEKSAGSSSEQELPKESVRSSDL